MTIERKLPVRGITAEEVLTLWQEGRLYIKEENDINKDKVRELILAYVSQISLFATHDYRTHIDNIWERILDREEFAAFMAPTPKARKFKAFNKYNVMRIIGVLREAGVYEPHNDRVYIARLEHTDKDNSYRCYIGKGIEQRPLLMELIKLTNKPYKPSGISQKPEKPFP